MLNHGGLVDLLNTLHSVLHFHKNIWPLAGTASFVWWRHFCQTTSTFTSSFYRKTLNYNYFLPRSCKSIIFCSLIIIFVSQCFNLGHTHTNLDWAIVSRESSLILFEFHINLIRKYPHNQIYASLLAEPFSLLPLDPSIHTHHTSKATISRYHFEIEIFILCQSV